MLFLINRSSSIATIVFFSIDQLKSPNEGLYCCHCQVIAQWSVLYIAVLMQCSCCWWLFSLSLSLELYILVSKSKQVTESSGNWFIHSIYSIHAMECSEPVIKRLIYWTGFHFFLSRVCVHYCGPNLYSLKYLLYHFKIHLCLLIVNDWNKLFSRMDVIHTHSQT